MSDSSKRDSPKSAEDEDESEVRNLKRIYRNPPNPGCETKISGLSSDEETTSSSLLPIPDTLRQMRGELKRIVTDSEESPEADSSSYSVPVGPTEVSNPFDELRRKYSMKNETSVAMKMNSANLMLDDILNGGRNLIQKEAFQQSKPFREREIKGKKVQESDTCSTAESASTVEHCKHGSLVPFFNHLHPSVPQEIIRCQCHHRHENPVRACPNFFYNGSPLLDRKEKEKKMSFLEKLNNLHLKYRIQSAYKIVQKKNPFNKNWNSDSSLRQGIPNASQTENSAAAPDFGRFQCDGKQCLTKQYPKRMIFDLVESSDYFQSDAKSTSRQCTCQSSKDCTCPELISRCDCMESHHDLEPSKYHFGPGMHPQLKNKSYNNLTSKVNDYAQTESADALISHDPSIDRRRSDSGPDPTANLESGSEPMDPNNESPSYSNPELVKSSPDPTRNSTQDSIPNPDPIQNPFQYSTENQKQINEPSKDETKPEFHDWKSHCFKERKLIERTDIYYFDHGNSSYYRTTDNHPVRYTECLVERTDEYATKFWGEVFGVIEIGVAFIISFVLQLYRFFFSSIIRSLTVGLLQIFSDYFFKPLLTITFNGIIQPCLILAYNIATSLRDLFFPISQIFGFFTREVANLLRSCRLVEINNNHGRLPACHCGNKV